MDIHEYQAKEILSRYGVAVPPGSYATTTEEAAPAPSTAVQGEVRKMSRFGAVSSRYVIAWSRGWKGRRLG